MDPQLMAMLAQMGGQAGFQFGSGGGLEGALGQLPGFSGGFFGGRKAKKEKKKLKKRIEQGRRTTESIFGNGMGQQEALARQATQQQLGGFDLAKRAAAQAAQGSKRNLLQREQQLGGQLSQSLTNRGLGSTSVGANIGRGLAADTSRGMSGIDEALGQYFGNLAMGRAGVEAQGTQGLADLASQRSNFDIQNANFWSPYNWQKLGAADTRLAQGFQGGAGGGMGGGMDPQMLAQLFGGK